MDIIYFITHKLLYSRTETWQILRQFFLFIFLSGRRLYYWFQLFDSQLSVHCHLNSKKRQKNPIFHPKILTIKLCIQIFKVQFDTESVCFLRNFFRSTMIIQATQIPTVITHTKPRTLPLWNFFFKWLEKSPSLNTVRVKINFKRLPGSASVLHKSVKSVIESPGQRAHLFLYLFFIWTL